MAAHKNTPDKFWGKVKIGLPDECWPWLASRSPSGYGKVKWHNVDYGAHRVAYALATGAALPREQRRATKITICVLHRCDNPPCCNPAHLWLGTILDNNRDRDLKGRASKGDQHFTRLHPELLARGDKSWSRLHPERLARGDKNGSRLHPEKLLHGDANPARKHPERMARGSAHGRAKLTERDIPVIRERLAAGDSHREIAKTFGISRSAVTNVNRGLFWRHVDS